VQELVQKGKPLGLATAVHWTRDTCCRPRIENPLRGQIWARTQAHQSWMASSMRVSGIDRIPDSSAVIRLGIAIPPPRPLALKPLSYQIQKVSFATHTILCGSSALAVAAVTIIRKLIAKTARIPCPPTLRSNLEGRSDLAWLQATVHQQRKRTSHVDLSP
jgi:hypothetical protein